MKHCQSELVSCKVEWFCSLAAFSWWPSLPLLLSFFPSISFCSAPCSFVLVTFLKRGEGASVVWVLARYLPALVWGTSSRRHQASPLQQLVFTADQQCCYLHLLFVCSASVFALICIQLNKKKQVPSSLSCFIELGTNSQV